MPKDGLIKVQLMTANDTYIHVLMESIKILEFIREGCNVIFRDREDMEWVSRNLPGTAVDKKQFSENIIKKRITFEK